MADLGSQSGATPAHDPHPQPDSNRRTRRERAVSWAARRWGPSAADQARDGTVSIVREPRHAPNPKDSPDTSRPRGAAAFVRSESLR